MTSSSLPSASNASKTAQFFILKFPRGHDFLEGQSIVTVAVHLVKNLLGLVGYDPVLDVLRLGNESIAVRVRCSEYALPGLAVQVDAVLDVLLGGMPPVPVGVEKTKDAAVVRHLPIGSDWNALVSEEGENPLRRMTADSDAPRTRFSAHDEKGSGRKNTCPQPVHSNRLGEEERKAKKVTCNLRN